MSSLNPKELEAGKKLAGMMLSRKLSKDEESVFIFGAGFGAGTKIAKQDGQILRPRPNFKTREEF